MMTVAPATLNASYSAVEQQQATEALSETALDAVQEESTASDQDTAFFSEEAQALAASSLLEPPESIAYGPTAVDDDQQFENLNSVAQASTQSGRRVTVNSYTAQAEDGSETHGYMMVVSGLEGEEEQRYLLNSDSMVTEDEDGSLKVQAYSRSSDTSGDDIIIAVGPEVNVDSGAGDDTVIVAANYVSSANIDTGAGNDRVTVAGEMRTGTIDTGEGDDSITAKGLGNNLGSGETLDIDTGGGDDS
ncbi:MAG: hypothetical protein PWQ57_3403, partial [Desulfovibrionales bacterium]|nr:hypothetical protein [Desulfovibrionales bacterium]